MAEWFEEQVLDTLKDYVEPWINPFKDKPEFWHIAFLLLALVVAYAIHKREVIIDYLKGEKRSEHDKQLFRKLNAIMSEQEVRDFISTLSDTAIYDSFALRKIDRLEQHRGVPESKFFNPKVDKQFIYFLTEMTELLHFIAVQFVPFSDTIYRMAPELQSRLELGDEDDMAKWKVLYDELGKVTANAQTAFDKYRETVKKELLV
jgi:hypothetical protein